MALASITRPDRSTARVGVATSGCTQIEANDLTGVEPLVSGKRARAGCRVTLDADRSTDAIDPFPAGTTFSFVMCAQTNASPACEGVWHSNPTRNPDRFDHVLTKEVRNGVVYQLGWEDTRNGGDRDFNDLMVNVRIATDRDGDGLWDDWETEGIDADGDGVIDVDLRSFDEDEALKADPDRKDIFVWIDYMGCSNNSPNCATGHKHALSKEVMDDVIEAFRNAPVDNPNGIRGINLHLVPGTEIPHEEFLYFGCKPDKDYEVPPNITTFDTLKKKYFGDDNPKRVAFRYAIIAHHQLPKYFSSGCGEFFGNDLEMTLGDSPTRKELAGTFMHELGHNLGLNHGGGDGDNDKPNYLSVMNYKFQMNHVPYRLTLDQLNPQPERSIRFPENRTVLDYSREALPGLDENALNEDAVYDIAARDEEFINIRDGNTLTVIRRREAYRPQRRCGGNWLEYFGNAQIDWNCDGRLLGRVSYNINGDSNGDGSPKLSVLNGFNDWANIMYDFQSHSQYENGVRHQLPVEITPQEVERQREELNQLPVAMVAPVEGAVLAKQIQLDASASFDPEAAPLTYEWRVLQGSAAVAQAHTAKPIVQFGSGYGEYIFEVTVSDGKGGHSTARTSVFYAGR